MCFDRGIVWLLFCLLLTPFTCLAQWSEASTDTTARPTHSRERTIEFTYAYMNPVSYRGRTFGVHQWGQMPQLTYQSVSGWRIYGVGYIWNDFQTSLLGKIDLGVEKEGSLGKHIGYTLGYERWFFPDSDPNENQPLSNFFNAFLSGDWHDWTPAVGLYYMVGSKQLLQTDMQLGHYIGLAEGYHWSLFTEPTLKVMLANQNLLINGLYQLPIDLRRRRVLPAESRPFGLVAGELSLPVTLETPRWTLLADPRVVKPYNTLSGERTKSFFYFTASVSYRLFINKKHGL